jgi:hypothetical protein
VGWGGVGWGGVGWGDFGQPRQHGPDQGDGVPPGLGSGRLPSFAGDAHTPPGVVVHAQAGGLVSVPTRSGDGTWAPVGHGQPATAGSRRTWPDRRHGPLTAFALVRGPSWQVGQRAPT